MKNTIKHFAGAGLATVMLLSVGCNDDPTEVYVADLYQKAYITTGIAPADEYTYKGTYHALGRVQMDGTTLEYFGPGLSTTLGTGYVFDIYLCTAYAAKTPVSGTLYVPENAEELVAQYNSRGGTEGGDTGGYLLMTPDRYEITVPQSTVAAGEKQAPAFQVSLNAEMDWSAGKYLLPVCCTLDAGSEVTLSENASTVYLKVEIQRDDTDGSSTTTFTKTSGYKLVGTKVEVVNNPQMPENSSFDISLRSYTSATSAMRGRLSVPEDAEAAVTEYNTANNTSYTLLPADYYSIENAEATIESGNDRSTQPFRVQLNEEALAAITKSSRYLLPVSLTMESGSTNTGRATLYIAVNIIKYRLLKPEEIVSYGFCTGDGFSGGGAYSDEYALDYAFDQNSTTAFMGDGSAMYDYYIDEAIYANLASPMRIHSIIFVNQNLATGWGTNYCPWYLYFGWTPNGVSYNNWIEYNPNGDLFECSYEHNTSTVYIDYNQYDYYYFGFADVYFTVLDEE